MTMTPVRICLWSSPRNLSTAFMYAWAQRADTTVVDEPLYGYYLKSSGANHPGKDEIMDSMECDAPKVIDHVLLGNYTTPIVFFKHMTHHNLGLAPTFMANMHNVFFIRDPKLIIASYAKVIPNPTMIDIGMAMQTEMFRYATTNGHKAYVIDSADILSNPKRTLTMLCNAIGIPFDAHMLQWKAGPRPEDGVWAKYWYANVHSSTGLGMKEKSSNAFPQNLKPLYEEAKMHYDSLMKFAIR